MQTKTNDNKSLFDLPTAPLYALTCLDFQLSSDLEASEPPEARGLSRDAVRLMVSYRKDNQIIHTTFRNLADFLEPGDVVGVSRSP
jgi:S-adenosylmethionine:tRNA ribosyltransferase-isomerase